MSRPMTLDEIDQDAADFYPHTAVQCLAAGDVEGADYFWEASGWWADQITERKMRAPARRQEKR